MHTTITTLAILVGATTLATAQPTSNEEADALFKRGRELAARHEYPAACEAFAKSEALQSSTGTVINLADCREQNGQLATAWMLYERAERESSGVTDPVGVALRARMKTSATRLQSRLSTLAIVVAPETARLDDLVIMRGTERVEAGSWEMMLPIDGGTYTITARAPGYPVWTTTVTIAPAGARETVTIPKLQKPVAVVAEEAVPAEIVAVANAPIRSRSRALVPIAIGIGVVAIGFEVWSRSIYEDAKSAGDREEQVQRWQSANTRRYVAEVTGVAALGCIGAAVYLRMRRKAPSRVSMVPVAGATSAGLVLGGAW